MTWTAPVSVIESGGVLVTDPDDHIAVGVSVEQAACYPVAEEVADLGIVGDPGRALMPQLITVGGDPGTRTADHIDHPGIGDPTGIITGDPDDDITKTVVVDIDDGQ